ncbi:MAG: response regulator transcription factor [Tannerella sp.]|jgi:DNA-binding response OmpR family regulator|nr:response regulator transcription factor [Tannerella sp.]
MIKLLYVEDDTSLGYLIKSGLEELIGGYEVRWITNGKECLKTMETFEPDVIVSDVEMAFMDGNEMARQIRLKDTQIPIIFLSAKEKVSDVARGYDSGANLYFKKPLLPDELDVHIRAMVKHVRSQPKKSGEVVYEIGKYTFAPQQFMLSCDSVLHRLTSLESGILTMLCENKGKLICRDDILKRFWNMSYDRLSNSRSLDVHLTKLRHYLSSDKSISINTVKKLGVWVEW